MSGAGELPDIEIKYEEILRPLAALAEQDAIFARLLLTLLCKAVYCLPSVGQDIRADVRIGLEAALQRTCNGISFVSCVQSLCLQDPEIWISPKLVGSVSRKSTNLHSGILLLENEIMHETFPEPTAERNKKRHRGQGGQINLEQQQHPLEDAWLELARLYKVVGEEDIVLALFQKHLTKHEITHKALEAQLGGDFEQANALYDKLTGWHQNGTLLTALSVLFTSKRPCTSGSPWGCSAWLNHLSFIFAVALWVCRHCMESAPLTYCIFHWVFFFLVFFFLFSARILKASVMGLSNRCTGGCSINHRNRYVV